MKAYFMLALAASLAAACASTNEPKYIDPATIVPAVSVIPESGLGPQTLESRECGLFLWSQTDPSKFIYFQKAGSGTARMQIGAEAVDATQTVNRGVVFGQFMTEQGFTGPQGEQVMLTFNPGEELQAGQRIESGRLSITTTEGWRTLIPVLGVRACQP